MPPSPDQMTALAERIVPIMQDFGLSAFVIVGYLSDADGNLRRVCIANAAKNPAFEDGLRPIIHCAHVWGAQPAIGGRHASGELPEERTDAGDETE